jgi:hypothetical protein
LGQRAIYARPSHIGFGQSYREIEIRVISYSMN